MIKKIRSAIYLFVIIIVSIFLMSEYSFRIKKYELVQKQLIVNKNDNIYTIYKKLGISYNILDKIYIRYIKSPFYIYEGTFDLDKLMTKDEIIKKINKNNAQYIKLTIPEGFTVDQVLDRMQALGIADKIDMLNEMQKYDFYYTHSYNFEGYFYPQTYFFTASESPKQILDKILGQFLEIFPIDKYGKDQMYEYLKMASIVEAEAKYDEDRDKIAKVFYNRLKINMKLQSDATLKYILGNVYKKDLMTSKSPYNTYYVNGMIPTPINNPGYKSIMAAINPKKEFDYLYFFMDKNGRTFYSKTHNEHLKLRRKFR